MEISTNGKYTIDGYEGKVFKLTGLKINLDGDTYLEFCELNSARDILCVLIKDFSTVNEYTGKDFIMIDDMIINDGDILVIDNERNNDTYIIKYRINDDGETIEEARYVNGEFNSPALMDREMFFSLVDFEKYNDIKNIGDIHEDSFPSLDFNVIIVKDKLGNYFYIGNDKENNRYDVIDVAFVGHKIIEREYKRKEISKDRLLGKLLTNNFIEVSPQELYEHVLESAVNYQTGIDYISKIAPRTYYDCKNYENVDPNKHREVACNETCECKDGCKKEEAENKESEELDADISPTYNYYLGNDKEMMKVWRRLWN